MSELRRRMIRDMQSRNFSPTTQGAYLRAVAGLAQYYHRSPDIIGPEQIQDYVVHLLSERKLAVGSCHAVITALRFFYTVTLKQDGASVAIPQIKRESRLPEILSPEQLEKLFAAPRNPKHRVLLILPEKVGFTPYVTVLPPTFWKQEKISVPSSCSWAIALS